MKINKEFFTNLSKQRYLEYVKTRVNFKEEKIQSYATILLTLFAFIFFSVFAIAPTLSTIAQLQKKLDDNKYVSNELTKKITALSSLQTQYNNLSSDLPTINAAIPEEPNGPQLISKIRFLANKNQVEISQLQITDIPLSQTDANKLQQYTVVIGANGDYDNLTAFYKDLVSFDRLLTISGISLSISKDLVGYRLLLQTKAFYLPE